MRNISVKIIWKFGQIVQRRCPLKFYISRALAGLLFSRGEPFVQFWLWALWENCCGHYGKIAVNLF